MANRYWVGGTATWDGTAGTKWSTTDGGAGGASVPTAADDVYFTSNSTGTVTVATTTGECRSLDFTGFSGTLAGSASILFGIGQTTNRGDNVLLKLSSSMTISGYTGQMTFYNTSATQATIDTAGKTVYSISINGGNVALSSAMTVARDLRIIQGTFSTNNHNLTVQRFTCNGSSLARTINLGSSIVTITGKDFITNVVDFEYSGITLNAGTSKVVIQNGLTTTTVNFGNVTWYDIEQTDSGNLTINKLTSCRNFTYSPAFCSPAYAQLLLKSSFTVTGTLTVEGADNYSRVLLDSDTSVKTITANAVSFDNVIINNITGAGSASWNFSSSNTVGDFGNNSGITFSSPQTLYHIGDGVDTTETTGWSTSSGGSGGARVPLPQDTQIFDENSFLSDGTCFYDIWYAGNIDFTDVQYEIYISGDTVNTIGDVTLTPDISGNFTLNFRKLGTQNYDPNGAAMDVIYVYGRKIGTTNKLNILSDCYGQTMAMGMGFSGHVELSSGINVELGTFNIYATSNSAFTMNTATMTLNGSSAFFSIVSGTTVSASSGTIISTYSGTASTEFVGLGNHYGKLERITNNNTGTFFLRGSPTFNILDVRNTGSACILRLTAGNSITVWNELYLWGSAGNLMSVDTQTSGARAYFQATPSALKVACNYISLKDNSALGSSTYYAGANSTTVSNVSGWTFTNPVYSLSATTGGDADANSNATADLVAEASASGDADAGGDGYSIQNGSGDTGGEAEVFAIGRLQTLLEALDKKTFLYKIFDKDDNYIGEWHDVISDFSLSQEINNIGSQINVELARTAETRNIVADPLIAGTGDFLVTQDNASISSFGETGAPFGEGTEIDLNYRVDIYLFYGFTDYLNAQNGDTIDDQTDIALEMTYGSPNGRKVFSGFISSYKARYGSAHTTVVTINSYGDELSNYLINNSGNVTVPYYSTDPSNILKDLLDRAQADGLKANYSSRSIDYTNTVVNYSFNLNNYQDGLSKVLELSPTDWLYYYDNAQNIVYLKGRPTVPDHYFILGKHIKDFEMNTDTSQIANTVYFTGGEVSAGVKFFAKYSDATSIADYGQQIKLMNDDRVLTNDVAYVLGQGEVERYKDPRNIATCSILTDTYPIEDIRLGELVAFRGFGNYIDDIELQIMRIDYNIDFVTLQMGSLLPTISKRVVETKKELDEQKAVGASGTPT